MASGIESKYQSTNFHSVLCPSLLLQFPHPPIAFLVELFVISEFLEFPLLSQIVQHWATRRVEQVLKWVNNKVVGTQCETATTWSDLDGKTQSNLILSALVERSSQVRESDKIRSGPTCSSCLVNWTLSE